MSNLKAKKKVKIPEDLTVKQKLAFKHMVEKGGSSADALRSAGYSKAIINNPARVFKSKGFAAVLDRAGLTDSFLAKKHKALINATRIEEKVFEAVRVSGFGKRAKYRQVSDEFIKISIEGTEDEPTGCTIITINSAHGYKRVIFRHPDSVVQAKAMDLAYKSKGHMAPDKLDLTVQTELDEDDMKVLDSIFSLNKK